MTGERSEILTPDVLIIGGGPAGLTAAAELGRSAAGDVVVVEREGNAGGIPRHSDHPGYGIRDLRRFISGPEYARRLVGQALTAGVSIRTQSMVTGWTVDGQAEVTGPTGRVTVRPRATILATGARERPRTARLVPGDRPQGVYTTGHLQNLVHLHHTSPGASAVVVGAELVSWSAVMTLREGGCRTALMVTEHETPESYGLFNVAGRFALRTPVATRTKIRRILGKGRVSGVEIEDLRSKRRRIVDCDTVVFTGDWIPDHELARLADVELDAGSLAPVVDGGLRTSRSGVFAAGNLVHPVDTADVAALDGRHVARSVTDFLGGLHPSSSSVRIRVEEPFRWVAPSVIRAGDTGPARGRLLLWTSHLVRHPQVSVVQGGRELHRRRIPWPASPGRAFRLPDTMISGVDFDGGDLAIRLH